MCGSKNKWGGREVSWLALEQLGKKKNGLCPLRVLKWCWGVETQGGALTNQHFTPPPIAFSILTQVDYFLVCWKPVNPWWILALTLGLVGLDVRKQLGIKWIWFWLRRGGWGARQGATVEWRLRSVSLFKTHMERFPRRLINHKENWDCP